MIKNAKGATRIISIVLVCLFVFTLFACDTGTLQGNEAISLSTPTNLKVNNTTLTWNPVENAIGYTVKIQAGKNASASEIGDEVMVDTNSYSLETLSDGDYTLSVKARGDSVIYSSSEFSSTIQYTRNSNTGLEYEDVVSGAFGSFDEINTRESYLGYGIDIINATGVTSKNIKTTYPIFAKDAILKETLLKSNEHYSVFSTVSGFSIEEFRAKLATSSSISAGSSLSASVKLKELEASVENSLSGGYTGAFEQTKSETYTQYFVEIMAENQNYWLMLQTQESRYREILSEEFKKDLYDPTVTPAQLFDKYGTHLLTSVAMGGNINMFYTLYSMQEGVTTEQYYEISTKLQSNASLSLKAGSEGASAGQTYELITQNSQAIEELKNRYSVNITENILISGGKGDFGITTVESLFGNYADWQKSLDSYPVVVGLKDSNSLYPIWNLIDTSLEGGAERYQELYNYFATYGQESYDELCQTYGIVAPVNPTDITNIQIKNNIDYKPGDLVQIKAGDTFQIKFDVLPDNANKYRKTFSVDSEYITIDESGNVVVSADIPNNMPVVFTITAGPIEKTITCQVIMTCNVIFNTVVPDLTVEPLIGIDSATTIPEPILQREGYILEGWYKDQEYTQKFDFDTHLVTSNLILYAKWVPIKPVITFNSNEGSAVESQTIAFNALVKEPDEPTKDGYNFAGWFIDKYLTEEFDFSTSVKGDITLYAKWEKIVFTVTFVTNGGTPVADKRTDIDNQYLIAFPTTEKTDFIFSGWFTDEDFLQEFLSTDKVTKNLTLYAKWTAIKPIVTYYPDNGTEKYEEVIAYGSTIEEPLDPTKDGYKFVGWYKDKDLTEKFDFSTVVYKKLSLYAKWEKLNFTVEFDSMGGTPVSDKTTSIDKNYLISEPESRRTHYTLDGWYKDKEYTIRFYFDQEVTENITLYAKWSINNISVKFVDQDGYSPLVAEDGEIISEKSTNYLKEFKIGEVPTPYKEGYVFLGWKMAGKEIDVTKYEFSNENANYKLMALWIDEEHAYPVKITINYVYEDGTTAYESYIDVSKYYEQSYEVKSPVIMGYAPDQYTVSGIVPADELVVEVCYKPAPFNVILNYVMADGSQAPKSKVVPVNYNGNYSVEVDALVGYTPDVAKVEGTMGAKDVEYTVTYTPNKYTFTVEYIMSNGKAAPETKTYTFNYNENYSITIEGIDGYTADKTSFLGKMPAENIKEMVTYVPNEYTVTVSFNFSDGNTMLVEPIVMKLDHLESYNISISNVTGYHPDQASISGTINAANVNVTVTYLPNTYTVYFHQNNGSGSMESQTFVYNAAKNLTANAFTRNGYTFKNWSVYANGTGTTYANGAAVSNLTAENNAEIHLYAQWKGNTNTIFLNGDAADITYTTQEEDQWVIIPTPSKADHRFMSWVTSRDYKDYVKVQNYTTLYIKANTYGDIALYADWVRTSYTYEREGTVDVWEDHAHRETIPGQFDVERLKALGYDTIKIEAEMWMFKIPGHATNQFVDFYFKSEKLKTAQYYLTQDNKWVENTFNFEIDINEIASDGSFDIAYTAWEQGNITNEKWSLGTVNITITFLDKK